MKNITIKQKLWELVRRDRQNVRRLVRKKKLIYFNTYGNWPPRSTLNHGRLHTIALPERISLETHYNELIKCIEKIRELGVRQKRRIFVDFSHVRYVGPCGALLLAAELDRWKTTCNIRHRIRPKKWNPDVLRLMDEMGLFEILGVVNPPKPSPQAQNDLFFFRFRTSSRTMAVHADMLADEIEAIAGHIPKRRKMYRGISEAMSNVANHAYPDDHKFDMPVLRNKWWMSGSFNHKTRHLTVMVFDQGVGIPFTLPREHTMEIVRGLLDSFKLVDDDASRIKISMELGKTQTGSTHRGKGLFRDIRPYTEEIPDGCLRVLSGRGEYTYTPKHPTQSNREQLKTHSKSIGGTLILWEGTLSE